MRVPMTAVPSGDLYGVGRTTVDLTNPTLDQDRDGQVDDMQRGQAPFPRAVLAVLAFFGALVALKFLFEKLT